MTVRRLPNGQWLLDDGSTSAVRRALFGQWVLVESAGAPPTFNAAWAVNANSVVGAGAVQ